jgi:hypothetical protein
MQDMKEAGTSLRIRRNLWYPVESLMQRIAMDAYLKVDKFYREKEGREGPVRNTKEILQEMSEEGKLPLIPRGDFHSMERLVEKIGYQAFVEIEEFYCEMEEYEEEEGEETETDI